MTAASAAQYPEPTPLANPEYDGEHDEIIPESQTKRPRKRRRPRERVEDGRIETGSARTALKRLCEALAEREITVELKVKKGEKQKRLVIDRPGRKRIVFSPHNSQLNLNLLGELARAPKSQGGGGMTWAEVRQATGWTTFNT